ncbi:hypothetical protein [Gracilibacillus xinjiangensis]|uniref:Lipoprotein n=1 Tax=Gracilibacillus xinjiangensis TaxID=1193282 RepID=A0ABV8WVK3_9BACI
MRKFEFFALALLLLSVFGCNQQERQERMEVDIIASEKSLPASFDEIATKHEYEQILVERAENKEEYQEMWEMFELKQDVLDVDMKAKDVLFIGFYESSSCPEEIKAITADTEQQELEINLKDPDSDCTADASPKNFVLAVDKRHLNEISNIILVTSGQRISFPVNE